MNRLPVGSPLWLYDPPFAPSEGVLTGYDDPLRGGLQVQCTRPRPQELLTRVYAYPHDWRRLVGDLRDHADALLHAAAVIEADYAYRKEEDTPCES